MHGYTKNLEYFIINIFSQTWKHFYFFEHLLVLWEAKGF